MVGVFYGVHSADALPQCRMFSLYQVAANVFTFVPLRSLTRRGAPLRMLGSTCWRRGHSQLRILKLIKLSIKRAGLATCKR